MKLWWPWCTLLCAWIFSILSARIWPSFSDINESYALSTMNKMTTDHPEDLMAMLILKPFHYITSSLFLLFTLLLLSFLVKKVIYECKVAYLLKKRPYEPLILFLMCGLIYVKSVTGFPYLTLSFSVIVCIYECSIYVSQRKKEAVYVKEG